MHATYQSDTTYVLCCVVNCYTAAVTIILVIIIMSIDNTNYMQPVFTTIITIMYAIRYYIIHLYTYARSLCAMQPVFITMS